MSNLRLRPLFYAVGALLLAWLLAWTGYTIAQNSKITAEKVQKYLNSVDLARLSAAERAAAIKRLEDMVNRLSPEERRDWRRERDQRNWFNEMTDDERGQFIEATMPTGFKQMLDGFAALPEDKRQKIIDNALKNLREDHSLNGRANPGPRGSQPLSPELEKKVREIGLRTFYTQSSPQTKAELAPLVEELQHQLQSGRGIR